ncbi:MAG TPA: hypothetical protein PKA88_16950 [Polyangiaceae bacterium]|nr:hypothetical protein [Polyangiaceae bacterium]
MRGKALACMLLLGSACAPASSAGPVPEAAPPRSAAQASVASAQPSARSSAPGSAPVAPAEPTAVAKTLGPDVAEKLATIRFDPPPPATTRSRHYFTSNEHAPELFQKSVNGLGGIVTGVGAEQMYLLAGWARADVLVLTDFDDFIVDLHEVYGTLFLEHDNVDAFLNAWSYRAQKQVQAALEKRFPTHESRWRKWRAFGQGRAEVKKRLEALRARFEKANVASFLTDAEQYRWLRTLWQERRVRAVRGDLTQDRALRDLATYAKQTGLVVRVLYLSNAEDYFTFQTRHYRDNVLGLPFDEKSVVLRTRPYAGSEYEYVVQPGLGFQAFLRADAPSTMCELVRHAVQTAQGADLYRLDAAPGATPARNYRCE